MLYVALIAAVVLVLFKLKGVGRRLGQLEDEVRRIELGTRHLSRTIADLRRAGTTAEVVSPTPAAAPAEAPIEPAQPSVATPPAAQAEPVKRPAEVPGPEKVPFPEAGRTATTVARPAMPAAPMAAGPSPAPAGAEAVAGGAQPAAAPSPAPAGAPSAAPPPPPPPPRPAPPASPPPSRPPRPAFDWESLVGVRLFSWIAGIALALGGVFFLRYSVEQGWLSPPVRMAMGLVTGTALLVACELRAARGYRPTANAMAAAGIALLFSTFFAAHALWHLLPMLATFAFMVLVTAIAVLLSIRRDSLFIALLGLVGGFATPALLASGQDRPIGLFGYLLLLNAGLAWVGWRKQWTVLAVLCLPFTAFYQWSWVIRHLDPARLGLAAAIFLVFPALSAVVALLGGREESENEKGEAFRRTTAAAAILPVFFALYAAAVPAYGARFGILFGFLFVVVLGLGAIAAARGPRWLHTGGAVASLLVFAVWTAGSYTPAAWPWILVITAAFLLFFLASPIIAARLGRPLGEAGDHAAFLATLLLFVFPALAAIEPRTAAPGLLFGSLFALLVAVGAVALALDRGHLHYAAAFCALLAEAVWSARHLDAERLIPALAIYGGFALFYLGLPLLARARNRPLRPEGGASALALLGIGLLFFLALGPVAATALWGLALLIAVLNLGSLAEAARGHHPVLAAASILLSWAVLAGWWSTVAIRSLLVPGLGVVAFFALLVLGGTAWAERRSSGPGAAAAGFGQAQFLALAGHLFLLFVAARPDLALPPWPLLGALFVLDLAIGVGSLYAGRGQVFVGAAAASQLVAMVWTDATLGGGPAFAPISVAVPVAVTVLAFLLYLAARRTVDAPRCHPFLVAAAVTSLLGQLAVALTQMQPSAPGLSWTLPAAVLLVALLLAVAAIAEVHALAVLAVPLAAATAFLWRGQHFRSELWQHELLLAGALYLPFLAYPVLLGRRARTPLEPWLGSVLAGVPFFFLARHAVIAGGLEGGIGLLPVGLAAAQCLLVARLLSLEPAAERQVGRLALVAGAALAWITLAIPLQLEKQWVTIGWALQAAALAWLYRRVPHKGLLLWTAGLAATALVRLTLNPALLAYYPRSDTPILNWYLYTYLVSAAALFATARLLAPTDHRLGGAALPPLLNGAAIVLLFALLNIEIADYHATGPQLSFHFSAGLSQDLTYTLGWALFAIALLVAGVVTSRRAPRVAAIGLLLATVLKCFLHDLARLGGLYRVGSMVGLAVSLALVALVLQRFVLRARTSPEPGTPRSENP